MDARTTVIRKVEPPRADGRVVRAGPVPTPVERPGFPVRCIVTGALLLLPLVPLPSSLGAQEAPGPPSPPDTAPATVSEALRGTAQLAGRVVAAETGAPLAQALVALPEAGVGTLSDSTGFFALTGLDPGTHPLEVRYLGRRSSRLEAELLPGQLTLLDLELTMDPVALEELEVTVTARERRRGKLAPFYERMEYGMGQYITRDEIEAHSGQRLSEVFRGVRGFRLRPCFSPGSQVPRVGCYYLVSTRVRTIRPPAGDVLSFL